MSCDHSGRVFLRGHALRLLLIAYEFPPSPSPQSLRWAFLVRELLAMGVEVHVLTAEPWWPAGNAQPPAGAVVHRAWPGGVAGIVALARRWRRIRGRPGLDAGKTTPEAEAGGAEGPKAGRPAAPKPPETLNWKGRALKGMNAFISRVTFPDERGRWEPYARRRLVKLLDTLKPDVVVSSHEPATTLRLGRIAKQRGFPWVADLGDPVLSFYTPARWRKASERLERWTCRNAEAVTVTTEAARRMLAERHDVPLSRFSVLTQGFDPPAAPVPDPGIEFDPLRLELLYTGSFYQFREPRALVEAVLGTPGARLNIATSRAPEWLLPLLDEHPDQLRLLGFVPHAQAVSLQRSADVLVNIANEDPVHVPGKVYEYLGAGRPILHVGDHDDDGAAQLVRTHRRGMVCGNGADAIASALAGLVTIKQGNAWEHSFQLDRAGVADYQWRSIGRRLHSILTGLEKAGPGGP